MSFGNLYIQKTIKEPKMIADLILLGLIIICMSYIVWLSKTYKGGVLTGKEIVRQIKLGNIFISDFNENHVNPNSYDVTLGKTIKVFPYLPYGIDPYKTDQIEMKTIELDEKGTEIAKGMCVLGYTNEWIRSDNYRPEINGKSSLGRLFLNIHQTAGYGDHGFQGRWTLEIVSLADTFILYPGMRIGQIEFSTIVGEPMPYKGKYQMQKGVTESKGV